MTSSTNKVTSKKKPTATIRPVLPKLLRVRLDSLECARKNKKNSEKLTSRIKRTVKVELEENLTPENPCRVVVNVSVQGTWNDSDAPEPTIVFSATYSATFNFALDISVVIATKWLDDDFYREAVISIAMPVIHLHMYSQLDIMGIGTNSRPLGMQSEMATKKITSKQTASRKTSRPLPEEPTK